MLNLLKFFAGRVLVLRASHKRLLRRFDSDLRDQVNGAIAHLGERLICIQKVVGSSPTGSTIINGECSGQARVLCKESEIGSSPIFSTSLALMCDTLVLCVTYMPHRKAYRSGSQIRCKPVILSSLQYRLRYPRLSVYVSIG